MHLWYNQHQKYNNQRCNFEAVHRDGSAQGAPVATRDQAAAAASVGVPHLTQYDFLHSPPSALQGYL